MEITSRSEAKAAGLTRYFTGKQCKRGHACLRSVPTGQCVECERWRADEKRKADPDKVRAAVRASAMKRRPVREQKTAKTPEQIRDSVKQYRVKNRERINALQAARRKSDPERYKAYHRKWAEKNLEGFRKSQRDRRVADAVYAFNGRARCLISNAIRRAGFRKAKRTEEILGCTVEELRRQIELQFLPGMTWQNMHAWHIDHIVPISLACTLEEAEALNKAGNLRPLWSEQNKTKGAKVTHLI